MNVSMDTTVLPDRAAYKLDGIKKTENSNVQNEEVNTIKEKKDVSQIESRVLLEKFDLVRAKMKRYYHGEISAKELKDEMFDYIRLCIKDVDATIKEKGELLAKEYDYICFRSTVIGNDENLKEGIEVAKRYGFDRSTMNIDFVYYNADYYYKWEEVMKMTGECADQMAEELGIKDFERQCRYNFNETWGWGNEYGKMINIEAAPPKDFTFFYRDQIISQEGKNFESTIYRSNMVVNGRLVGDGEVGGKGITFSVPGKLADYPNRNHYYYPAMNAYDFYFKYGGGGDNELCGFLRNFVLYSKNKMFTDYIEEDLAKKSYLKYSYQAKMSMYMKQQRIME